MGAIQSAYVYIKYFAKKLYNLLINKLSGFITHIGISKSNHKFSIKALPLYKKAMQSADTYTILCWDVMENHLINWFYTLLLVPSMLYQT